MNDTKIDYRGPHFLNKLALATPNEGYSLGVTLRPDVDSIIRLVDMRSRFRLESLIPEIQKDLERDQLAEDQIIELASLPLWDEHQVYPFWSLEFDYHFGAKPKLVYEGPRSEGCEESIIRNFSPETFLAPRRWFGVRLFNDFHGNEIREIKRMVYEFTGKRYRVNSLAIRKNPRMEGECLECDGALFASRGAIEIARDRTGDLGKLIEKATLGNGNSFK